jgi:anti-sigma-K factor RskA
MNSETHDHINDQLAAYALNILDTPEAAQIEAHLVACATCREELQAYQEVIDLLALTLPTAAPPPSLKGKLLQKIDAEQKGAQPARWWRNWHGWYAKRPFWQPVLAVLVILLLISNWQLRQQLNDATTPANFGTVTLTGTEVNTTGILIISADGKHGTLVVQNLPQLPESEAYQLWLIKDGERTSGGLFNVDEDGYRAMWVGSPDPLDSYQNFGVTIEPAAGSPSPTGNKVLGN